MLVKEGSVGRGGGGRVEREGEGELIGEGGTETPWWAIPSRFWGDRWGVVVVEATSIASTSSKHAKEREKAERFAAGHVAVGPLSFA
jgi:hypothetical protein